MTATPNRLELTLDHLSPARPRPAPAGDPLRGLLGELAFVLRMTARVKAEILAGRPAMAAGQADRPAAELVADLGA